MVLVIFLINVLIRKIKEMKKNMNLKGKRKSKRVEEKKNFFKKILFTKEESSSSDKDEFSDSETKVVLFMEVENSDEEGFEEQYE
jgi:hypothetical protein